MGVSTVSLYAFLGLGLVMTRDTATLMVGQYFKRKRDLVEVVHVAGSGAGIAFMAYFLRETTRYVIGRPSKMAKGKH